MTREDIIRMAHEAGLHLATDVNWMPIIDFAYAEKFAALVAAAERERCVLILERLHERSGGQHNQYLYAAKVLKGEV
jgi:hypothetical protein